MRSIPKDEACPECGGWKKIENTLCESCFHAAMDVRIDALMSPQKQSLLDGMASEERKQYPIISGCLDYFRDALLKVSHVSWLGNQKHNPGQPLHWARGKSTDEIDALGRHLAGRENIDVIDPAHSELTVEEGAEMVWRALAWYQKFLEAKYNIKPPPGCK